MAKNDPRPVVLCVLGAVCVAGAWAVLSTAAYAVTVSGAAAGYVKDPAVVADALTQLQRAAAEKVGKPVEAAQKVELRRVYLQRVVALNAEEVEKRLAELVGFKVKGVALVVDGRQIVAVPDAAAAAGVLAEIKEEARQAAAKRGGTTVDSVEFVESVEFGDVLVDVDEVKTKEEAKLILRRGTDEILVHTVKRGDSLWAIAAANNVSVQDLERANPGVVPTRLAIGQKIDLIVPSPYITVLTRETVTETRLIPFGEQVHEDPEMWPWQRVVQKGGEYGKRELTLVVDRRNGLELSRRLVREIRLKEPVTQVVTVGTKQIPARGTGEFVWPVLGKVTSPFGYRRGRFHGGIDIAAPSGTPVLAADSGVVVLSGYHRSYGKTVVIEHGNGISTLYAHNSSLVVNVGQFVEKGQVISSVGSTGQSTGPHLHFEVRVQGEPVNPINYYPR